ncbi:hypothetical protein Golax_014598, partial [Gossypium laxum]|nr:hypothetical protein [Gossypium laxum]
LRRAIRDFDPLLAIGRSSFEDVYKGTIKPADAKIFSFHIHLGTKEWLAEVQFLGVVEHPNLIKLIGHSAVNGKREIPRLLVYEFMQNKSLDYHLFQSAFPPLPWKTRLQIILGAAQGLAYLHEGLAVQFNPKLLGFGLATEGPMAGDTHVSTDVSIVFPVVGTYGYADPCYLRTGHLTVKSHIWGFGVVLYEILSGRRSIDRELPQAKELLLHWVKRSPAGRKKFISIMDPGLGNQYSIGAAREIARLADACLLTSPEGRPKMSEVVERLKQIIQVSEEGSADKMESHPEASESEIKAGEPETNSNTAELVAIKYAMESFLKAARKGEALLIIESDSTTAVQWIQDYDSRPMKLWPMPQEIDTLISQIGTVVFNITPL